jgi:hypothetical protein
MENLQSYHDILQPDDDYPKYPGWVRLSVIVGLSLVSTTVFVLAMIGGFTVCKWLGVI